jgi:hypothetical protein
MLHPLAHLTRQSYQPPHRPGPSPAAHPRALAINVPAGSIATAREANEKGREVKLLRGVGAEDDLYVLPLRLAPPPAQSPPPPCLTPTVSPAPSTSSSPTPAALVILRPTSPFPAQSTSPAPSDSASEPAAAIIPVAPPMSSYFPKCPFKVICCYCFRDDHDVRYTVAENNHDRSKIYSPDLLLLDRPVRSMAFCSSVFWDVSHLISLS